MIDIEKPKIEIAEISEDARYGKFICEPLERGYGTTFGNSLRRMLLSSLEGAAITSIRIDGVYGRIETTEAKAKELRKFADRCITLAKRGDLAARRQAIAAIQDEDAVRKLFNEIGGKYADRQGGYTRIMKIGSRRGDAAPMVLIELV